MIWWRCFLYNFQKLITLAVESNLLGGVGELKGRVFVFVGDDEAVVLTQTGAGRD